MTTLTIGTRGSQLALAQTHQVAQALRDAHPGLEIGIEIISTKGDRVLDIALSKIGDKGLFVKEIEQALGEGRIDLAVHSAKDLPSRLMDGLMLGAIPARADACDALVILNGQHTSSSFGLVALPHAAHVGSSSLRRASQLRALRADVRIGEIRGNVDTRLHKLAHGQYDAIVLAAGGLHRLGLIAPQPSDAPQTFASGGSSFTALLLPTHLMLPAVAQGALGIECRADDERTLALLQPLNDADTCACVTAERAFLRTLEGGCQIPVAAYATITNRVLHMRGLVASLDGATGVRGECAGDVAQAETLGHALANQLLANGGAAILDAIRSQMFQPDRTLRLLSATTN